VVDPHGEDPLDLDLDFENQDEDYEDDDVEYEGHDEERDIAE
jgi:hypothetical protein